MSLSLGIFGKTYARPDAGAVIAAVAADGFSAVQFNLVSAGLPTLPDAVPDAVAAEVRAGLALHRVAPAALSGTYNLIDPDLSRRAACRSRLAGLLAAAPAMGFRLVTVCTGTRDASDMWRAHPDNGTEAAWSEMRAELDLLLPAAQAAGVTLGIEPELGNVVATPRHAARLLREAGAGALGIVLDPANLEEHPTPASSREAVSRAVEAVGERISLAHGKDRTRAGREAAAGRGSVDFAHFIGALAGASYGGPIVLHGLAEEEARAAAAHLARSAEAAGIALAGRSGLEGRAP